MSVDEIAEGIKTAGKPVEKVVLQRVGGTTAAIDQVFTHTSIFIQLRMAISQAQIRYKLQTEERNCWINTWL